MDHPNGELLCATSLTGSGRRNELHHAINTLDDFRIWINDTIARARATSGPSRPMSCDHHDYRHRPRSKLSKQQMALTSKYQKASWWGWEVDHLLASVMYWRWIRSHMLREAIEREIKWGDRHQRNKWL